MTDRIDPKAIADELRACVELGTYSGGGYKYVEVGPEEAILAAATIEALVKEMHARELHHFEEEQKSAGLAAVVEKVRGVIGAEIGWESPAILIDRIQWALSTAPADALAEHDRQVAERAWDEGFDAGRDDLGAAAVSIEHGEDENPYHKEQDQPVEGEPT